MIFHCRICFCQTPPPPKKKAFSFRFFTAGKGFCFLHNYFFVHFVKFVFWSVSLFLSKTYLCLVHNLRASVQCKCVCVGGGGGCVLRHGIQNSMEAILACHQPRSCELWRMRTGPSFQLFFLSRRFCSSRALWVASHRLLHWVNTPQTRIKKNPLIGSTFIFWSRALLWVVKWKRDVGFSTNLSRQWTTWHSSGKSLLCQTDDINAFPSDPILSVALHPKVSNRWKKVDKHCDACKSIFTRFLVKRQERNRKRSFHQASSPKERKQSIFPWCLQKYSLDFWSSVKKETCAATAPFNSFHQARPRRNERNQSPLLSPNPETSGVQRASRMRKRLGLSFRPGNRADFPSGNCLHHTATRHCNLLKV